MNIFEISKKVSEILAKQSEIKKLAESIKKNPLVFGSDSSQSVHVRFDLSTYKFVGIDSELEIQAETLEKLLEAVNDCLQKAHSVGNNLTE